MFPMASVKEEIMTRIPGVGLNQSRSEGKKDNGEEDFIVE